MKKLYLLFGMLCVCSWGQTSTVQGHTFLGGIPATTSGTNSSNDMNGIIPGASVTVYLTGTQTKATIYADGSNTPLSNPFFSNASGATNPGGFIFWAKNGQGLDVQAQGGQQNASCTTSPLCYTQATMLLVDVTPGNSSAALPLQHNSLSTGILQTLLNFCDNGTCGTAVPAGQQQVTFGPDATGGWSAWTASTVAQFQALQNAPSTAQHTIVYPTSYTISDCQTQGGFGSATDTGGTAQARSPSGSSCVVSVTWNFTAPSNIPIANITAVYPFVVGGSTITTGTGPGTSNEAHFHCNGVGVTDPNIVQPGVIYSTVGYPSAQYTSTTSLTVNTTNFNAMTCAIDSGTTDGIVGQPNAVYTTAYLVGAYVYYSGTPVTTPTYLNVQSPLRFDGTTNTLSLDLPFDTAVDTGTANAYVVTDGAFPSAVNGVEVSFLPLNASTSTSPTLNVNGWGAFTIVGPTGQPLSSGDIASFATNGYIARVRLGGGSGTYNGFRWWLENPQVSGAGGVSSVSNSDGSLTISPTSGAVVASVNYAHAGTWTALETFNSGISIPSGQGVTQTTGGSTSNCWNTAGTTTACSGGGGGTPAGLTGSGQYNASGSFGGTNVIYLAPPVQPPGTVTATPSTTGGTLAAGTYYVIATATNGTGQTIGSPEASATTTGTTGSIALSWTAITGATGYRVYVGTSSGGEGQYFTTATASFTVTTATGTAGTVPAQNTTADMGAEINSAVTALGANPSGGVIMLPAGSWNIATTATLNNRKFTLAGYGARASLGTCTVAGDCIAVHPDYFGGSPSGQPIGNTLHDFSLVGNGAASQVDIHHVDTIGGTEYNLFLDGTNGAATSICDEYENSSYWTERNVTLNVQTGYNCAVGVELLQDAGDTNISFGYNYFQFWQAPNVSGQVGFYVNCSARACDLYGGSLQLTENSVTGTTAFQTNGVNTINGEYENLAINEEGGGALFNITGGTAVYTGYANSGGTQGTPYSANFYITNFQGTRYATFNSDQNNQPGGAGVNLSNGSFNIPWEVVCSNLTGANQCNLEVGKSASINNALQVKFTLSGDASAPTGILDIYGGTKEALHWHSDGTMLFPAYLNAAGFKTDASGNLSAVTSTGSGNTVLATTPTLTTPLFTSYTVATLPSCAAGQKGEMAAVTDATSPSYLGTLTGGGAVFAPVVCNGTAWVSY